MKEIQLTQGKVALVDDEDYDYLSRWKWFAWFSKTGNCFYARRSVYIGKGEYKTISMHREILSISDPQVKVDHISVGETLNNQRSNLRIATAKQNNANTKSRKNSSSKFLGVSWYPQTNRWHAQIKADKKIGLGYFKNEIEAAIAYNNAAKVIHGEFANLNSV